MSASEPAAIARRIGDLGLAINGLAMRYYTNPAFKLGAFTNPDNGGAPRGDRPDQARHRRGARDGRQPDDALARPGWLRLCLPARLCPGLGHEVDGIREVAAHDPDCLISIEYKPNEPRAYSLLADAATTLLAIAEAGAAQSRRDARLRACRSMPASSRHSRPRSCSASSRLLGVHLNDGYAKRDDGLMVGAVHCAADPRAAAPDPARRLRRRDLFRHVSRCDRARSGGRVRGEHRHRRVGCSRIVDRLEGDNRLGEALGRQDADRHPGDRQRVPDRSLIGRVRVKPIIVVVGSLHFDIMVDAPDRPRKGETVTGFAWRPKFGGKGGNQAVAAAKAGAEVRMVGAVGDDDFGRFLLDALAAGSVDASRVARLPNAGSGMSVAISDAGGDYGAVIVSGANLLTDPAILGEPGLWRGVRALILQNEMPEALNVAAARAAKSGQSDGLPQRRPLSIPYRKNSPHWSTCWWSMRSKPKN